MVKISSKIKAIKKTIRKRPRFFIVSCLVAVVLIEGAAFAVIHTVQTLNNQANKTVEEKPAKSTKPDTIKSSPESLAPSPSPSGNADPAPASAQTPQKTTSSKPPGWYWPTKESQECLKKLNDGYIKYNADLKAENIRYQAALAELKAAYDNGEYNDPYPYGPPNDYYYQLDVQAEKNQWTATTTAINDTNRALNDSLNC